ncbi:hypothetical protein SDJN02_26626, partial [Cucurbita argyrosperma subsp. argyrosperma]
MGTTVDLSVNCYDDVVFEYRRGLSRYYSGKSRSFACIADVRCVEDLKKPKHPEAKKRKKQSDCKEIHVPPYHCRRISSQCSIPFFTA